MALQDVCGLHNPPLFPQWSAPLSRFFMPEDSTHLADKPTENRPSTPLSAVHLSSSTHTLPHLSLRSVTVLSLSHGTTTLGFAFQGGVIAAADRRSSCSGLVACPASPKVLPIYSHLLRLYQLRHRRRLSTGGAAKPMHPFKGTELCSFDNMRICGPRVIYVCSDGLRLQGELFSVGSGSPYAYSILDSSVFWGMSAQEATEVAREAVFRATYRDAYSGNNVDLYHVTAKGRRRRESARLICTLFY
uniref:Proteasome subunit beta type-11-like n=1 Tax=Sinocyclocheilus anshuiensis TaxID=1608454 RepID=A0A671MXN5_9TELE